MSAAPLRWAFFGSSLVSSFWNGAATYYRGIIRQLGQRGHHVTFYEPDAYHRQQHRDITDPSWAEVHVYPNSKEGLARALEHACDADILIKASGVGVFDEHLEAVIPTLKRPKNLVLFWDVDAPATLERMEKNVADPFRALVPKYDFILTYGGGAPVVGKYATFGAKGCFPIYNALDPDDHFAVGPDSRFAGFLGFLGNRLPDREERVNEFFFEPLRHFPSRTFLLGGNGWDTKTMPANVRYLRHVFTYEHNAFNSTAMAVLNVCRQSMADCGFSPPTRIFEAAGAKACIISDAWTGIESFLEPGKEILIARDAAGVVEILAALDESTARRVGEAACHRIKQQHTYEHRINELTSIVEQFL
jgi:spore maturation protein CgeB